MTNFNAEELYACFAVLVRISVIFAVLPIFSDRAVPAPAKILLSLAVTFAVFPGLVKSGAVRPADAAIWSATSYGIAKTVGTEVLVGLVLGFTARLVFDAINFGANLIGNLMGFAMATTYDPHQESQTLVVGQLQIAIATLAFLAADGHYLMLRAALDSFALCGVGEGALNEVFQTRLIDLTGQTLKIGMQLSAPIAVVLFGINVAFGVFSKAIPQMNILVLSMGITAFVGMVVMLFGNEEFQTVASVVMSRTGDWMSGMMLSMVGK